MVCRVCHMRACLRVVQAMVGRAGELATLPSRHAPTHVHFKATWGQVGQGRAMTVQMG